MAVDDGDGIAAAVVVVVAIEHSFAAFQFVADRVSVVYVVVMGSVCLGFAV